MSTSQRWSLEDERPSGWPRINYNLHYQDNARNECATDDKMALVKLDECKGAAWRLLMAPFFLVQSFRPTFHSLFVVSSSSAFKDCPTFWPGTIHEIREGGSLFLFVSSIIRVISWKWRELKAKSTILCRFGWVSSGGCAGLV